MKKITAFIMSVFITAAFCAAQVPGSAFRQEGIASWYGAEFEGRPTASGEIFDPGKFTAAHPDLPFGTVLVVTNAVNGEQVVVRVNDRGPFVKSRVIDVSRAAAEKLNMIETGTAQVIIELAPKNASISDNAMLDVSAPDSSRTQTAAGTADFTVPSDASQTSQTSPRTTIAGTPQYTPQQPAVVQPALPPPVAAATSAAPPPQAARQTAGQSATQTAPAAPQAARQAAPAVPQPTTGPAAPQAARQPTRATPPANRTAAPPPVASYQPIPTAPRPPVVLPVAPPPASASSPAPSASAPQAQRSYPGYAKAEILGGPFVNGRQYRIQVGSYKVAKNAVEVFDRLTKAGFNPQWEPFENLYRIVLTNVRAEDVASIATKLGEAGFNEAIAREER